MSVEDKIQFMRSAVKHQLLGNYDIEEEAVDNLLDSYPGFVQRAVRMAFYPYTPADAVAEIAGLTYNGKLDKQMEEDSAGLEI